MKLKCFHSKDDWWTEGAVYDVWKKTDLFYHVYDDNDEDSMICKKYLFEVGSDTRSLFTKDLEDSFTTIEEDEEWQRIDQKQSEQSVDCPVAIAYHIHELQKWLKHIGCSSEAEFRISSDYVWASPDEFVIYEAKEGGVGTLIEYMRHIGGANKCVEKMEDVG